MELLPMWYNKSKPKPKPFDLSKCPLRSVRSIQSGVRRPPHYCALWARRKRRGFRPGSVACHSQAARINTNILFHFLTDLFLFKTGHEMSAFDVISAWGFGGKKSEGTGRGGGKKRRKKETNSRRQVVNAFSTGFWGNSCEQVLNRHLNAEASQSRLSPAPQAIYFEGRDKVVSCRRASSRDFSAFFLLDIWHSKTGCLRDICVMMDIFETMWEGARLVGGKKQSDLPKGINEYIYTMRRHCSLETMHNVITLHHLAFDLQGALEHTSCLSNDNVLWPLIGKENQLGPLLLLLLLFGNQNRLVILIILVDCCARSNSGSTPWSHPEREPSLTCRSPQLHFQWSVQIGFFF